jgi:hypothetical protein
MRLGAALAVLAMTYFVAVVVALHFLCPAFDPTYRFLSEYARSDHGAWMTSTFFVMAGGVFALALGLYCEARAARRFWLGPILTALCGVFLLLLGAFTTDLQEGPYTATGRVHDFASLFPVACALSTMALFVLRFKGDPQWGPWHRPTLVVACAAVGVVVLAYLVQGGLRWSGLIQRSLALPALAWLLLLATGLIAAARREEARAKTTAPPLETRPAGAPD